MKKLLATAAFVAMTAASGSAYADDSVTSIVTLDGTAAPTCTVAAGTTHTIGSNWTITGLITGQNVNVASVTDANIGTVTCNYGAKAGLKTLKGGMTGPVAAGGFDHTINYAASLSWGALTGPSFTTNGTANTKVESEDTGPRIGQVGLTITPQANTKPLVAGNYTDTLTVKIGATI
jgi:hypothetical protein